MWLLFFSLGGLCKPDGKHSADSDGQRGRTGLAAQLPDLVAGCRLRPQLPEEAAAWRRQQPT